jgi:hypothetical protein
MCVKTAALNYIENYLEHEVLDGTLYTARGAIFYALQNALRILKRPDLSRYIDVVVSQEHHGVTIRTGLVFNDAVTRALGLFDTDIQALWLLGAWPRFTKLVREYMPQFG